MNSLNIDCLIEIVKFLKLEDQITLYQVNSSLQLAVTTLWRIKYKHVLIKFLEVSFTNQEFGIFLETIKDVVEVLELRFLPKEKYEIMKQFCFKRVHNFRYILSYPFFLEDSDLKDLKKMLPNLKAFSPHGNLSGVYMNEWPLLKDLNLSFCSKLEIKHFQTIMNQLKLEKLKLNIFPNNKEYEQMNLVDAQMEHLKYLELNTYEFYYFLAKPLNSLKELIIKNRYNPRQLFDVLLSIWQAKDIRLVETANVDNILVNCVEMHLNVEQLTINCDENSLPSNIISSLHLLTDLRKLRFKSCLIKYKNFINLLKNTPQLQDISFEHCQFDVANVCVKVEEIITNRSEKLRLNMFENRLMDNLERPVWSRAIQEINYVSVDVVGDHNLIELTQLNGADLCYEPLYVVFR